MGAYFRPIDDFGNIVIRIPGLRRPSPETLREEFPWIGEIVYDTSPESSLMLSLGTVLSEGERRINWETYEARRIALDRMLGYQHLLWIERHRHSMPGLCRLPGRVSIDAPGMLVKHRTSGKKWFPSLLIKGKSWHLGFRCIWSPFYLHSRIACGILE
jgi:hypothetical protein